MHFRNSISWKLDFKQKIHYTGKLPFLHFQDISQKSAFFCTSLTKNLIGILCKEYSHFKLVMVVIINYLKKYLSENILNIYQKKKKKKAYFLCLISSMSLHIATFLLQVDVGLLCNWVETSFSSRSVTT